MLGKLARWMRILGFDVAYYCTIDDEKLLSLAADEGRTILTRDKELLKKAPRNGLLIESESWSEQIEQVLNHFQLRDRVAPYTRCLVCNTILHELPKVKAKNVVPDFIYKRNETFAQCPDCARIFWKGSHYDNMNKKIALLIDEKGENGSQNNN